MSTLRRTTDDRVLWGVAGGVAERMGVDAVVVRVAFVAAVGFWGVGAAVYLALGAVMPQVDWPTTNPVRPGLRPARWRGGAVLTVVLGLMATARAAGLMPPDRVLLPWALVVVGVGLVWGRDPLRPLARRAIGDGGFPPTATVESDEVFDSEPARVGTSHDEAADRQAPTSDRRRPPRSGPAPVPLGTLTAGALLAAVGILYLADAGRLVDVSWTLVAAAALMVLGLALVAGGWWGRPRGLIPAGSALVVLLFAATVVQVPIAGGVGRRDVVVSDSGEYRLAAGTLRLVLDPRDPPGVVTASVAVGQLHVVIPEGVAVDVDVRTGLGSFDLFGVTDKGLAVELDIDGSGTILLDLDVGVGSIVVERPDA